MNKVPFNGEILEYQGNKLPDAIKYSGTADQYETISEVKDAGKWPNDADILAMVNRKNMTAAKAAEYQKVTADLKKNYEESPEFKRKQLITAVMAAGKSQAEAEAFAASVLG